MSISKDLHHHRKSYSKAELLESTVAKNPFEQFALWFQEAQDSEILEANAMVLATASADAKPAARIVLLKSFNEEGFVFYTNYQSRKGKEILENPFGQILFYWDIMERQVRIEGTLQQVSPSQSDEYFLSRPLESQYGAIVSNQSEGIPSRQYLEDKLAELKMEGKAERPPHWGGYTLAPTYFEFWQGRENRLHDRIAYWRKGNDWEINRIAP